MSIEIESADNHPVPGEGSPYNLQRMPAAPPSPATNTYYPPTPTHNSMRYVQQCQSPYGNTVSYQDNPYNTCTPAVVNEWQQPVEFVRSDNSMAVQVQSRISLLTNMPPKLEYLTTIPQNWITQTDSYWERERERMSYIDRVRERQRERDCVVVPPPQTSNLQDPGPSVREPKPELQQQLMIETRQEPTPASNPQVEAIFPTLLFKSGFENANYRSTKYDILQQISKIDREISKVKNTILKLKKKEQELEEASCQPDGKKDEEEERLTQQPKHQSMAQKIYSENRRKAQKAHAVLEKLGPKVQLPLYNQPSDTPVYHENKRKHLLFKKRLVEHLRNKTKEKEAREKYMTNTYLRLMQEWHRKVEKIESSAKRKAKDAKYREFFEKVFPELRKQREDRERFNRAGAHIKSEAGQGQDMEIKKMWSNAVIPPLLLDASQRRYCYVNNNGRIEDFAAEYKERQVLNVWTKAERDIFKEKFLQHPKNFGVIASYLDRKSYCDCVQYYYHSKKEENYKLLLRKLRQRKRSSQNQHRKVNNASEAGASAEASNDPIDSILTL